VSDGVSLTVVVTTRNREAFLSQAIASVLASPLIAGPKQIVVVDDASTDGTASVVAPYGVHYVHVRAGRCGVARNAGLALVQTEYVAFLDDDDIWLPNNLLAQLSALESDPEAAFAYGRAQRVSPELEPFGEPVPEPPLGSGSDLPFVYRERIQIGVIVFRTAMVRAAGGFDPRVQYVEDMNLLFRLAARHRIIGIDTVGLLYRQRPADPAAAERSWTIFREYCRETRRLRKRHPGVPWQTWLPADLRFSGRTSYYLTQDAAVALAAGRRGSAARILSYALRTSPVHALFRHHEFWGVLRGLARR
jgi:glycosyltransferase involved in cell wall biosynthesis